MNAKKVQINVLFVFKEIIENPFQIATANQDFSKTMLINAKHAHILVKNVKIHQHIAQSAPKEIISILSPIVNAKINIIKTKPKNANHVCLNAICVLMRILVNLVLQEKEDQEM